MATNYGHEKYKYQDLREGQIRLLRLPKTGRPRTYQLRSVELASAPIYMTLSYSWSIDKIDDEREGTEDVTSEPPKVHNVFVNSAVVKVTKNLAKALPHLADSYQNQDIWIDGICLDQENWAERLVQIPRMGEIYRKSSKCVVWLGESNSSIDKGVPAIPALLQRLQWYNPRLGFVEEHFRAHGIPSPDDAIWKGLGDVLAKSWFTRVWTFQEAALPKELEILCGKNLIPSEMLGQLVSFMLAMPESGSLEQISARVLPRNARIQAGLQRVAIVGAARYQRAQAFPQSHFLDLLASGAKWECRQPKNKIYGVLGLVENDEELKKVLNPVANEYVSAAGLFLKFAKFWFRRDPFFQLFHFPPSGHLSSEIQEENDPRFAASELPSWCPSLLDTQIATTFWYHGVASGYRAGIQVGRNARIALTGDEKIIQVEGFVVDKIAKVEPCPWERQAYQNDASRSEGARRVIEWDRRCLELSKSTYAQNTAADGGADEVPDAHWRTVIANKHADGRYYAESGLESYRLAMIHMSKMTRPPHPLSSRDQLLARQPRTAQQELAMMDYIEAWGYASHGRSYFTTESGRVGLGPQHTQPGNLVCMFYNGGSPFILRLKDTNSYFLLGESYVHGLMYGEAPGLKDRGSDKFFTLV